MIVAIRRVLLALLIKFDSSLGRRDAHAHDEEFDDAPGDNEIDEHREDSRPFENASLSPRDPEDCRKRRSKRCRHHVDETGETGSSIGAEKFQYETKSKKYFDDTEDVPDDLGSAVEGTGAA